MSKLPVVEQSTPQNAAALALEASRRKAEVTAEDARARASQTVWCYSCDRKQGHFGLFFTADPRAKQVFHGGDWYAVYHDSSEPFWGDVATDLVCQQCFAETGERVALWVARATEEDALHRREGIHFRIAQNWLERFVFSVPRADIERWLPPKPKDKDHAGEPTEPDAAT